MRKTIPMFAAFVVILAGCAAPQQRAPEPAAVDTSTVSAFLTEYIKAVEARDENAIRDAYATSDRFAWLEDGKVRYRSADEVLAGLRSIPAATPIRTTLTDLVVVPVGVNAAHARATFTTTIGAPPSAFTIGGAITFVLESHTGTWKIVAGHTSSPSRR
jgi:hypothetical protein